MMGRGGIRLGRILGIPVAIDWTLLVIAGLLTVSLAGDRYPMEFPGEPVGSYWVVGIVTAAVFFASVLAHELAHSVVARRHGIRVDGITLWMLGGMARLDGEARSPRAEFVIAAVGPGTSLVLAGVFGLGATAISALGGPGLLGSALGWLALINAILAVFNLMPAAPLDGGRILASVLWSIHGNRDRATATAAQVGVGFGWVLVALGAVSWIVGLGFGGLWTALIGWFVISAARAEREFARSRLAFGDARVGDVMTPNPQKARGWLTVDEFLRDDAPRLHDRVVAVERYDGGIAGLANVEQLRSIPPSEAVTRRVLDYTVQRPLIRTAQRDDRLADVAVRPARGPTESILVFDGDRLVGIVTPTDLERARAAASTHASAD
ncbi:MAG: site-2 protease family protein [Actinomycetota bacterium]|nr:site-2 protease family protein [Actinomycetota bacterium]